MSTIARPSVAAPPREEDVSSYVDHSPYRRTGLKLLGTLVVWVLLWLVFRGKATLATPFQDTNSLHEWLNRRRDYVQLHGRDNWFFHGVIGGISSAFNSIVEFLQKLISIPAFPRPVPEIGWVGVVALLVWIAYVVAGWRSAVLVGASVLMFGVFGLWQDSLDLLIITTVAVLLCVVIGIPLGIWMARRRAVSAAITPVLDVMQTMPSFAYLTPMSLFFGIGPACAVALTLIYSLPPLIRITEHGIRSVPATTLEAANSLGVTPRQMLAKVQLPLARRTIIVGVNQCMMAALSMATIAALVNGPGLGKDVIAALTSLDVGSASVAAIAIVLMAIMLDRTTTAASERSESRGRASDSRLGSRLGAPLGTSARRGVAGGLFVVVLVAIYLSRTYLGLARFPSVSGVPVLRWFDGPHLSKVITSANNNVIDAIGTFTRSVANTVTSDVLNPAQSLVANSPWWVMGAMLLAVAFILGGWRPLVTTAVCLGIILGTGLWNDSMITLTMTLVATLLVMVVAIVLGVAMGRSRRTDLVIRPILDAFQTIPPFVYLVPALALFPPGRFTAIVAALAYAVPIATKLVADGIRGVSATTVEAVTSSGSTSWQVISKVQLPMAREALVLATNQGLLYVLSMVVVGGLVGGGSLGYLVVSGFSQDQLFGKGLAAGVAITAIGVMLDRITRHAAARYGT